MSQRRPDYDALRAREYQFALFRRTDSEDSRPFDNAILRSAEQAEEYMKLNYLPHVWPALEVRKRPAPARWVKL